MPLLASETNIKQVFSDLSDDENFICYLRSGGWKRTIIVLTDRQKIILMSFPYFGKPAILRSIQVMSIKECDYLSNINFHNLYIAAEEGSELFKLPTNRTQQLKPFFDNIFMNNTNAIPSYMEKDEIIMETIKTKTGHIRITDKNVYKLDKDNAIKGKVISKEKIPLLSLQEFDYYPGKMDSLFIYMKKENGESELFKIGVFGSTASVVSDPDPDKMIEHLNHAMAAKGINLTPAYFTQGENTITTCRTAHSHVGIINPGIILRLTNKRILELKKESDGSLKLEQSIDLAAISKAKVTKHVRRNQNSVQSVSWEIKVQTNDGAAYKFWAADEWAYSVNKIFEQMKMYDDV